MRVKRYSELIQLSTFEERFNYLRLGGSVGADTFGFDRIFNQKFYRSSEWRKIRNLIIVRDGGCDLGVSGHEIYSRIIIHHMNPISLSDIEESTDILLDLEYLIVTSHDTHNAIHYGCESLLPQKPTERKKNDTCPWKQ